MRLEEEGTAPAAWPNNLSLPLGPIAAEPLWQEDEAAFEAGVARVAKRILTVLPRIKVRPLITFPMYAPYAPLPPYGPLPPHAPSTTLTPPHPGAAPQPR